MPNNAPSVDVRSVAQAYIQHVRGAIDARLPRCLAQLIFSYANLDATLLAGEIVADSVTGHYASTADEFENIRCFRLRLSKDDEMIVFTLMCRDYDVDHVVHDAMPMKHVYGAFNRDSFRGFLHDMYMASVRWGRHDEYGVMSGQIASQIRAAYLARISQRVPQLRACLALKR